jgi:hypothetical protein
MVGASAGVVIEHVPGGVLCTRTGVVPASTDL